MPILKNTISENKNILISKKTSLLLICVLSFLLVMFLSWNLMARGVDIKNSLHPIFGINFCQFTLNM